MGSLSGRLAYEYNHDNLTMFLQGAKPRPDAISWHEYTCSYKDPADSCLAHLDLWTTHIGDAHAVMQSTLGTALPIMITEWNYAADQSTQNNGLPFDDGKVQQCQFYKSVDDKSPGHSGGEPGFCFDAIFGD